MNHQSNEYNLVFHDVLIHFTSDSLSLPPAVGPITPTEDKVLTV